jgi:hypothetical protein
MAKPSEDYKNLEKKYGLPSLKELENEFDVELKEEGKILKHVVEKMLDKTEEFSRVLESTIFSSHDPSKLYEAEMIRSRRGEMFMVYKTLMSLSWEGRKVMLTSDDRACAEFIKKVHAEWTKNCKQKATELFSLFEEEWKKVEISNNNHEALYYG